MRPSLMLAIGLLIMVEVFKLTAVPPHSMIAGSVIILPLAVIIVVEAVVFTLVISITVNMIQLHSTGVNSLVIQ